MTGWTYDEREGWVPDSPDAPERVAVTGEFETELLDVAGQPMPVSDIIDGLLLTRCVKRFWRSYVLAAVAGAAASWLIFTFWPTPFTEQVETIRADPTHAIPNYVLDTVGRVPTMRSAAGVAPPGSLHRLPSPPLNHRFRAQW
jgi:hypothetical protein